MESDQRLLFNDRPASRVIPFESISPGLKPLPVPKMPAVAPRRQSRRIAQKGTPAGQRELDFLAPTPPPTGPPPKAEVQSFLRCDAKVAGVRPRARAAAYDGFVVACAYAVFLAVFRLLGGTVMFSRTALVVGGASLVLILLFYKLVACIGGVDTPGARQAGLRLLHFDGRPAERRQRFVRLLAGFLSALPFGLGLLWALWDQEKLTWHDQISSTFFTTRP